MTSKSTISHSSHLEALTWLRGIAAFFVIISHTLRATEVQYNPLDQVFSYNLLSVFDLGTFGVLLFFTLSGTTLYVSNANAQDKLDTISFYIKRVFRIWPAYLVSLVLYLAFAPLFAEIYQQPNGLWIEKQFLREISWAELPSYLFLSFNITGPSGLINNAYWSLPVEFQYYLLFPLIMLSIKFLGAFGPVIFAAGTYFIYRSEWHIFSDSKVFMLGFTFCFGVAIGYIYKHNLVKLKLKGVVGVILLILAVILSSAIANVWFKLPDLPIVSNVWICLGLLAAFCVMLVLHSDIYLSPRLKAMLMRYGEISYSVYLYHNLLIAGAVCILISYDVHQNYARFSIVMFASSILTYYVATLSFNRVEKVFISYGRRLSAKFK